MREGYDCKGIYYKERLLNSKMADITNQKFNKLTALFPVETNKKQVRSAFWLTQCECGNLFIAKATALKTGNTKSCGCILTPDLTGQIFNYLTVIGKDLEYTKTHRKDNRTIWKCQCKCGNITFADSYSLTSGHTQSCGCYHKEKIQRDITGMKFYCLTALEQIPDERVRGSTLWKFQCDCGQIVIAPLSMVVSGGKKSCGCLTLSYGENKIKQILEENNITFLHDKPYFEDLIMTKGGIGRYDFILIDKNNQPYRLIEFDGEQHLNARPDFWDGIEGFYIRKQNDEIKNNYALKHNLPLIRIPYTQEKQIDLEMILGDQFLIKE